ncbi:MAG: tetracycline resistance MFS efflux pump [Acidimicrobiia bacterium]
MSTRRAAIAFIFITVVLDILALGIVIPVLPVLVEEFLGGDTARAATVFGLFGTVWALMQFVFAPVLGSLSDRFGRRPVILLSCLGLGLDYVLMALAPTITWLFVGRVLSGVTSASFATAGAYIADVTPPERRAAGFGMIGAAFGVGFVLGPALGGVLGAVDPRLPFWVAGALALLNAGYGYFVLPESLPVEQRKPFSWRRANPLGTLEMLRRHAGLLGLASVAVIYHLVHHVLPSVYVLYVGYRYGWDPRQTGLTLAAVGVMSVIVQGGLVRPLVAKLGERRTLLIGLAAGIAGYLIFGLADRSSTFLMGVPIFGLMGLFNPSLQGLMTRRVAPSEQGQLQGINGSFMGLTGIVGPGLFTSVFALAIGRGAGAHLPGAPFVLAASLLGVAWVVAWRVTMEPSS